MRVLRAKETKRQKEFSTKPGAYYYKNHADLMQMMQLIKYCSLFGIGIPWNCNVTLFVQFSPGIVQLYKMEPEKK